MEIAGGSGRRIWSSMVVAYLALVLYGNWVTATILNPKQDHLFSVELVELPISIDRLKLEIVILIT